MEVKKKTMYNVVFWGWAGITVICYIWGLISMIKWIISWF